MTITRLGFGLNLDDCRDPDSGEINQWDEDVLDDVDTYADVSPSGTGQRLIGLGFFPDGGYRGDADGGDGYPEMYDTARYLTVTGHHVDGTPEDERQVHQAVKDVHAEHIAGDDDSDGENPPTPTKATVGADLADSEVFEKAKNAENGEQFRALWNGDTSGHDDDHSRADLALLGHLAFWTGGDPGQMERLFGQSGLSREKWTSREDYRDRTIRKALDGHTEFYGGEHAASDGGTATASTTGGDTTGDTSSLDALTLANVAAVAGEDGIDDGADQAKAASVWELLWRGSEYHVCVRRDNGSRWGYDNGVWKPEGKRVPGLRGYGQ